MRARHPARLAGLILAGAAAAASAQSPCPGIQCGFADIRPGTYALAVIHDESMNGKLDTNALGIAKEGYGFANDAMAWFGAPSFPDASFPCDGRTLDLTIGLNY